MAFGPHLQEDAEYVDRETGDDDAGDDACYDVAEICQETFHEYSWGGTGC